MNKRGITESEKSNKADMPVGIADDGRYGVTAEFYDLIYADSAPDDIPFYLDLAAQLGGPVLELGCGTGRVALPLARAGHSVVGLDVSAQMLGRFEAKLAGEPSEVRKRVRLVKGSMEQFELDGRFALVITPFRSFQHLLEPSQQRSCLEAIAKHLAPGGRFVFNAFAPNLPYIARAIQQGPVWQLDSEAADEQNLRVIRRSHYSEYQPGEQVFDVHWKFEECDRFGKLLNTRFEKMKLRWIYRFEAEYLLELCGLEIENSYGDFSKTALGESAKELIYVCKKAGN